MKKKKFPISRLGLGTAQFGMDYGFSRELANEEVKEILDEASTEITFLDTAREYGDSEKKIGNYIRKNPGRFTVSTKLAIIDEETVKFPHKVKHFLTESLERSRSALGESFLPLLLLHQTDPSILKNANFWDALAKLKQDHKFKFGVSVYDPEPTGELINSRGDLIDCVQAPYSVLDRRFESLAKLLQEKGIVFISRSTFLKGALVEERLPTELRGLEPIRNKLKEISKKTGLSVPQLLTLFALSASFIDCTLIGVRSVEQLRENLNLNRSLGEFSGYRKELEMDVEPFLRDPRQWKTL